MVNRKLGRTTDQRMAMLRNQVTNLIWYGKIETTLARGKEVQALAKQLGVEELFAHNLEEAGEGLL